MMTRVKKILTTTVLMIAMAATVALSGGCDHRYRRMHYGRPHYPGRHGSYYARRHYPRHGRYYRHHSFDRPRAHWDDDDWEDRRDAREDYYEDRREAREDYLEALRDDDWEDRRDARREYYEDLRDAREDYYDDLYDD